MCIGQKAEETTIIHLQAIAFAQYVAKKRADYENEENFSAYAIRYKKCTYVLCMSTYTTTHSIFILAVRIYNDTLVASISSYYNHMCVQTNMAFCQRLHTHIYLCVWMSVCEWVTNNDTEVSGKLQRGFKFLASQ